MKRIISHSLERANSKNFVRSGKTFQFLAFRAQLQLCSSPVQTLISNLPPPPSPPHPPPAPHPPHCMQLGKFNLEIDLTRIKLESRQNKRRQLNIFKVSKWNLHDAAFVRWSADPCVCSSMRPEKTRKAKVVRSTRVLQRYPCPHVLWSFFYQHY